MMSTSTRRAVLLLVIGFLATAPAARINDNAHESGVDEQQAKSLSESAEIDQRRQDRHSTDARSFFDSSLWGKTNKTNPMQEATSVNHQPQSLFEHSGMEQRRQGHQSAVSENFFDFTLWGKEYQKTPMELQFEALEHMSEQDCEEKCSSEALYGRWRQTSKAVYGFLCWNEESQSPYCECGEERQSNCAGLVNNEAVGSSFVAISAHDQGSHLEAHDESANALGGVVASAADEHEHSARVEGSPTKTVEDFCDSAGLAKMHGKAAETDLDHGDETIDGIRDVETKIIADVARELETNNVDKMAKDIFSFYVCARWAPDQVFWKLAEQELPAQIADATIGTAETDGTGKEGTTQAIAEMYQKYQFVPMLCSRNLEVYRETDDRDHTYFTKFKSEVQALAKWLGSTKNSAVAQSLANIDNTFCGKKPMNSCDRNAVQKALAGTLQEFCPKWICGESEESLWQQLGAMFKNFGNFKDAKPAFKEDFKRWKTRFPYHSFIGKPKGWTGDVASSPKANERFVVCFGKRVASELHRRPNGQHILTDQNNIGCHGWYDAAAASDQLNRLLAMWKPPTCQLATMTYTMKKEILAKFKEMNERLFDSLPSMINDELQEQETDGEFNFEDHLPKPFDPKELQEQGSNRVFVDGMRVRGTWSGGTNRFCLEYEPQDKKGQKKCKSGFMVGENDYGIVMNLSEKKVMVQWQWSGSTELKEVATTKSYHMVNTKMLKIMPHGWKAKKGFHAHVKDLVAGVSHITDKALELFNAMFSKKQKNLADLMSSSVSKWAVCPIKQEGINIKDLENNLGVEDAAFQDFQKEAYKKWTGFEAKIPGEACSEPKHYLASVKGFELTRACEINELHADHVEKHFKDNGKQEDFICPLRPPLPASEQLSILEKKKGTCFLRMTGKQEQHYTWHYQGHFPARRQNDKKPNEPKTEYEVVRLMKVSEGGIHSEVNFGRFCSLEELNDNPRFCEQPNINNNYGSVSEFAKSLGSSLAGVLSSTGSKDVDFAAPLGIGATAVTESVSDFQAQKILECGKKYNKSECAKDIAVVVGEHVMDNIGGAKRLLVSSAKHAVKKLKPAPPGSSRILTELDERFFGKSTAGEMLHALSFQKSAGKDGKTSKSKERYMRYVLTYPCPHFDPAQQFSTNKRWSDIAVRMVTAAYKVLEENDLESGKPTKTEEMLKAPSLHLALRGEALRFEEEHTKAKNDKYYKSLATMLWKRGELHEPAAIKCELVGDSCKPADVCKTETKWDPEFLKWNNKDKWCEPRTSVLAASGAWFQVSDATLHTLVSPAVETGKTKNLEIYRGVEMSMQCGTKRDFLDGTVSTTTSFKDCVEKGVEINAILKAREPWKLYFPDEVIVVAKFQELTKRYCSWKAEAVKDELCQDAEKITSVPGHLEDGNDGLLRSLQPSKAKYLGAHFGAGWPRATPDEVVLQPHDILEPLGIIKQSF